jgi:hypothetical protein
MVCGIRARLREAENGSIAGASQRNCMKRRHSTSNGAFR